MHFYIKMSSSLLQRWLPSSSTAHAAMSLTKHQVSQHQSWKIKQLQLIKTVPPLQHSVKFKTCSNQKKLLSAEKCPTASNRCTNRRRSSASPASTPSTAGRSNWQNDQLVGAKSDGTQWKMPKNKRKIVLDLLEVVLLLLLHSLGGVSPACRPIALVLQHRDEKPAEAASTLLITWKFDIFQI